MSKKMDRTLSRTPEDVERKYGLGRKTTAQGSSAQADLQIQQLAQSISAVEQALSQKVSLGDIVNEIDTEATFEDSQFYNANAVNGIAFELVSLIEVFGQVADYIGNLEQRIEVLETQSKIIDEISALVGGGIPELINEISGLVGGDEE